MPEVDRRYFEGLMDDKNMSLRALAKRMNMGHSQLSLAFSGARKLTLNEASELAQIFNQPLSRVVEAAGVTVRKSSSERVQVAGAVRGDGTVAEHDPSVVERTNNVPDLPEDVIALHCRTAGSPLDFIDGWVAFCRKPDKVDPSVIGRLAYCKVKNGPAVLASVRRGYEDGTYNLAGFYTRESAILEFATPILLIRP